VIAVPALAALSGALVAAVVDARTGLIPDALTRSTALAALGFACANGGVPLACGGAYAVGGTLLALHLLTRGRGLGLGDVKLGTAIGAGFGPSAGVCALGTAFVLGGAYASWLLLTRRARRGDAIRFGPFLAAGTVAAAFVPVTAFV
jgi:leader peptidase (prepilin peptidase)/N-methyltransferase